MGEIVDYTGRGYAARGPIAGPDVPPTDSNVYFTGTVLHVYNKETLAWVAISSTNWNKRTEIFYIEDPTASDDFPVMSTSTAITITKVRSYTDTGTVTFQLHERTSPASGTGAIMTSALVADAGGESTTSFTNSDIDAEDWVAYVSSAVASSPTKLWIAIDYTVDA